MSAPGDPRPERWTTPTMVAQASRCLHAWFLECHGDPAEKRPPDAGTRLMQERGLEHERRMVSTLEDVVTPSWNEKDWRQGHASTVGLMREGHRWIYQGALLSGFMRGKPDLLRRVEGESALGTHTYVPIDIKGHAKPTKKDRFQLLAYSLLLEPVLGARPETGAIWLKTGDVQDIDLRKDREQFQDLLSRMVAVHKGAVKTLGLRCSECSTCAWIDHCREEWQRDKSICLVRGVDVSAARRLLDAGVRSYEELARREPAELGRSLRWSQARAREIVLHAKARALGTPLRKSPAEFPKGMPVYFYDIEIYGECTYLHGVIRLHENEREERSFLARGPAEEAEAWRSFLSCLSRDSGAVVYCWADYEREFIFRLWEAHGGDADGWRLLSENLRDQCAFVRDHFAFPVVTYSIKEVAPCLGFHWDAEDAGGLNSEMWYKEWLETGDEGILGKIVRYNLDDVRAMEVIHRRLEGLGGVR